MKFIVNIMIIFSIIYAISLLPLHIKDLLYAEDTYTYIYKNIYLVRGLIEGLLTALFLSLFFHTYGTKNMLLETFLSLVIYAVIVFTNQLYTSGLFSKWYVDYDSMVRISVLALVYILYKVKISNNMTNRFKYTFFILLMLIASILIIFEYNSNYKLFMSSNKHTLEPAYIF